MKIAVPWPVKEKSQPRIREALSLWEDPAHLLVCLVEPCDDPFLSSFDTVVLPRNSTTVGTKVPKCFIQDMLRATREQFPNEAWYGFSNSDCVPVGDILEDHYDYDCLIYHRTDINQWKYRHNLLADTPIPPDLVKQVWCWRQEGVSDKRISQRLNRMKLPPPEGEKEWSASMLQEIFDEHGKVFFWGQDMYLFSHRVIDQALEEYFAVKDPILGTGGFDPRLSKWCVTNFKSDRMLNKIFHRRHKSEWTRDEVEYRHNGGDIDLHERIDMYDKRCITTFCDYGQRGVIPKHIKYLVGKYNPELYARLFAKEPKLPDSIMI